MWVAVILGGSGSNRGALLGGFVIVAIREGSRFVNDVAWFPIEGAPLRLLLIGLLIVLVMRFRPQGVLPPQRELIWPSAVDGENATERPARGVRKRKGSDNLENRDGDRRDDSDDRDGSDPNGGDDR